MRGEEPSKPGLFVVSSYKREHAGTIGEQIRGFIAHKGQGSFAASPQVARPSEQRRNEFVVLPHKEGAPNRSWFQLT